MTPEEDYFQKNVQRLSELLDMMGKAGFLTRHGYSEKDKVGAVRFTQSGWAIVEALKALDGIGTLSKEDRLRLWHFLRLAKEQRRGPLP
jgi:DNA-binding HxlR family transcriptional regulator